MDIKANRAFIISDTHLGARSNSVEWIEMMTDWFKEDFIPKVKELYRPGDILIHNGDLFDNRQSVNLLVMHYGIELFEELSKIFVDGIYVIAGNHDVMRKSSNDISSLDSLKYIPNVNIIKEPEIASIQTNSGDVRLLFMPWRTNVEEERKCLKDHEVQACDYLFCHTNIYNLRFDRMRNVEEGLKDEDLDKFKRVYSGHIHWGQVRGNVVMVGNPYQMTRSDAGNDKGWYLLDFETSEHEFYINEYSPKFVKIQMNHWKDRTLEELKNECENNRVDLYVPSTWLMKYNINPVIDELSKISKKLEIIPFELDLSSDETLNEGDGAVYNIYDLCEKYVNGMSGVSETLREKMLKKINKVYLETVNENR